MCLGSIEGKAWGDGDLEERKTNNNVRLTSERSGIVRFSFRPAPLAKIAPSALRKLALTDHVLSLRLVQSKERLSSIHAILDDDLRSSGWEVVSYIHSS